MTSVFLSEIILITTAAFVGGFTARSLKLPPVLGYIASGIIFGIIGKSFFESYNSLLALSQFGVSLLLFTLGFEISLDVLAKLNKRIILVGGFQMIFCALALFPLLLFFSFEANTSIFLSILFSFSSTAVVVKLLEERGMLNNYPGNNIFIILLIQDIFIIPIIFLFPLLFSKINISPTLVADFLLAAIKPFLIFIAILFFFRLFLSRILNLLFKYPSHELTILASIFTATSSILLLSAAGLPQSIAAFLAGVLISEQGKNLAPLTEIRPFRDLFLVLFFVLTGMLLDFNFLVQNLPLVFSIALIVIILKFAVTYVILRFTRHTPSASVFISSYLANVGEFSPIIGQIAFVSFFISKRDYDLLLSVFILSLLFIPFWVKYSRVLTEKAARLGILGKIINEDDSLYQVSAQKMENHVVICGHGRVGRETSTMLDFSGKPYVVVDFNRKIIGDLVKKSKTAIYGDPTDEEILAATGIDAAKVLVIAIPDTFSQKKIITTALKLNPKIIIFCRSHIEGDRYDLINMGVNTIIVPELEAGLKMGMEVLDIFGVDEREIDSFVKRLRREHLL